MLKTTLKNGDIRRKQEICGGVKNIMKEFLNQSILSLGTGLLTGIVFAFMRLPIPAPPVIPAVFGILGITLGYMIFGRFFG